MFEEEAKERARKLEESQTLGVYDNDEDYARDSGWNDGEVAGYEKGFKDGAKFGYNKANEWHNLNENYKDLPNEGEWVEGLYIWYYKDEPHWDVFKVRWCYEIGELDEKLVRWYGADEYNTYDRDYWNKVDEPDYWRKITLPTRNEHDRKY